MVGLHVAFYQNLLCVLLTDFVALSAATVAFVDTGIVAAVDLMQQLWQWMLVLQDKLRQALS